MFENVFTLFRRFILCRLFLPSLLPLFPNCAYISFHFQKQEVIRCKFFP